MLKNTKKVLAFVLAMVMMFSLSATAYASPEKPDTTNPEVLGGDAIPPSASADCSTYVPNVSGSAAEISVTFIMEAPNEYESVEGKFYVEKSVTLATADKAEENYTVYDILNKVGGTDGLSFSFKTNSATGEKYLDGVTHDGTTFAPGRFDHWGWEFRVNDSMPVQYDSTLDGYIGLAINRTPISDGDVIHFFLDYPESVYGVSYNTDYIRIEEVSAESGSITVQLQSMLVNIVSATQQLQVFNYEKYTDAVALTLEKADGSTLSAAVTSDGNGQYTLSSNEIVAGESYVIKSSSALLGNDPNEEWVDCLFTRTTGYKVITVPTAN